MSVCSLKPAKIEIKEVNGVGYVVLDVSKRRCRVMVVDEGGVFVDEFSFSNDVKGMGWFVSRDPRLYGGKRKRVYG